MPRRDFSKVTDNQATELYFEEIFEQGFAAGDPLFDLRNYFYPESEVYCHFQEGETQVTMNSGSCDRAAEQCRMCSRGS